jgi:hypothetical protein
MIQSDTGRHQEEREELERNRKGKIVGRQKRLEKKKKKIILETKRQIPNVGLSSARI